MDKFKEKWLGTRIREKVAELPRDLSGGDLQTLYALITLMCRKDPCSREWLRILVDNLDRIMRHLADNAKDDAASLLPSAIGSSHPDVVVFGRSPPTARRFITSPGSVLDITDGATRTT